MCQETIGYSLMKYHMHIRYFTVSRKLKTLNEYYIRTCTPYSSVPLWLAYNQSFWTVDSSWIQSLISHSVTHTSVSRSFWTCKFSLFVISLVNCHWRVVSLSLSCGSFAILTSPGLSLSGPPREFRGPRANIRSGALWCSEWWLAMSYCAKHWQSAC